MKFKLIPLLAVVVLLSCCQAQVSNPDGSAAPDPEAEFSDKLPSPSEYPDHDPHLLVPQWDKESNTWVYIDRTSREQVVPLSFHTAGRIQRGMAYATTLDRETGVGDVYRVYPDGKHERIYKGKPGAMKDERDCMYYRTGDDYFFVNQGSQNALFDPEGKLLWEQECPYEYFYVGNEYPAYLGEGRMLILKGDHYEFKDQDFKTVATLDTSKYGIIMDDRHEDWARIGFRVPLVLAIDRERKKVGFFNYLGEMVVPFEYSPSPFSEFIHTREYKEGIWQYPYKEDRYGHIPVFTSTQNGLIKNDGSVVWTIPIPFRFLGDPQILFNPKTNQIPLESSTWEGHDAVFDLSTGEEVSQQAVEATLSEDLYLVREETGMAGWSLVLKNASFDRVASPLDSISKYFSCFPLNGISPKIYSTRKVIPDESNSSKSENGSGVIRDILSSNQAFDLFPPQKWWAINSEGQFRMFENALNLRGTETSSRSFEYFKVWYEIGGDTLTVFYSENLHRVTDTLSGSPVTAESCFDHYHNRYVLNNNDWRDESLANVLVFVFFDDESGQYGYYLDFFGNRFGEDSVDHSTH